MLDKDEIINDLVRKKPTGPKNVSLTYDVQEEYDYRSDKVTKLYTPSIDGYGYSDDQLFSLGFLGRDEVESYLRKRDFEGKSDWSLGRTKSTLTRRTNNVWCKIEGAVTRINREGRPGIYSVTGDWKREEFGHIYAESMDEARQNAQLFFGYLHDSPLKVWFKKMGSINDLADLNLSSQQNIEKAIQAAQSNLENYQASLENLNSRLSTLKIVEQQQIAVEMLHAIEEVADLKDSAPNDKLKDEL